MIVLKVSTLAVYEIISAEVVTVIEGGFVTVASTFPTVSDCSKN